MVELRVGAEMMKEFGVDECFRYLRGYFTVGGGLDNAKNIGLVSDAARRCGRLHLKPRQKMELLVGYVLPAYYHLFFADLQSKLSLDRLDSDIRQTCKEFFHLPASTSNGLLYFRKSDGQCRDC